MTTATFLAYWRRHWQLWWTADTRAIEAVSAYIALGWAAFLRLEGSKAATIYDRLTAVIPIDGWVVAFTIAGLAQALAVCFLVQHVRRFCAGVMFGLWSFIASCYIMSGQATVTAYIYVVFASIATWVALRGPSNHDWTSDA